MRRGPSTTMSPTIISLVTSIAGLLLAYWVARKVAKGLLVLAVLGLVAHTLLPTQLGKLVQEFHSP